MMLYIYPAPFYFSEIMKFVIISVPQRNKNVSVKEQRTDR